MFLSKYTYKNLIIYVKLIVIIIFCCCYPFSIHNEAKADSSNVIYDAQYGCSTDDSGDSDESKDDSGKDSKSDSGGSEGDIPNAKNIKPIYEKLHDEHGFSAVFIAGILGNWMVESKLDPTSNEPMKYGEKSAKEATDGQLGIGFGQWTAERHTALVDWAKDKHDTKKWYDTDIELDFMVKGDEGFNDKLKNLALDSGDDPKDEAVNFHKDWEISADSDAEIRENRGGNAKKIYDYMKKHDMDGDKDESKIKKMGGGKSSKSSGKSSADTDKEKTVEEDCEPSDDENSSGSGDGSKIGDSTKVNNKKGKTITENYEYDDLPKKYKKYVKIPKFQEKYLEGSLFAKGRDKGQCTELTWAYMNQMWKGKQPSDDGTTTNGNRVHEVYKKEGAKVTEKPTVGYGFSADPPQAGAEDASVGHTGVVAGVMPDGKWIMASYNLPPKPAPSRTLYFTVVDGTDGEIKFFSGISKKPKKNQ